MNGRIAARRRMVVFAMTAIAGLAACDRSEPGSVPPLAEPPLVTTARPTVAGGVVSLPATVRTVERAELASRTSGRVLEVRIDAGSVVSRGDVLLVLDGEAVAARARQAEAEAERARRSFARIEALQRDGAATDQELDDTRARLAVAEAGLEEARIQRAYTVLRAPFAGTVVSRSIDPGDLAIPGRPVLTLAGTGALEVVADVPASLEGSVAVGDTLFVLHPETGVRIPARVARVAPAVQVASQRFRVEATLPPATAPSLATGSRLVPGAYVRVELPDPGSATLWVPAESVVRRGQLTGVFTVEGDTARLRWIRPGNRRAGAVEVLGGLSAADILVRRPPPGLEDGRPVQPVRSEPAPPSRGAVTPDEIIDGNES